LLKLIYSDDITLGTQNSKLEITGEVLTEDLATISAYLHKWRPKPTVDKTLATTLHLNNRLADHQPKIVFCGSIFKYDQTPKT